jgi:DMSO reductase family type II enzyme molybdopterin subunit
MAKTAMKTLEKAGDVAGVYGSTEDLYRQTWKWDRVVWGTHCVDCYPGNCPYRVYIKDGIVLHEEQAATYETIEEGVPDMNPMGCQKGAMWGQMLYSKERVLHPLKRVGPRGSGRWKRISWDDALTEVADAVIDAIKEVGPESLIHEITGAQGGPMALTSCVRFLGKLGGLSMDLDGTVGDLAMGLYEVFGKIFASTVDDWFHSDLLLIWHMNPAYTRIPYYHYISEARYKGAEVVTIAPDFSPSAVHADRFVPVRMGTDAALAMAMCKVIIDEDLYDADFIREQTDLPLLIRRDNQRFLRQSDLEEGGKDDAFYFLDMKTGSIAEAPRGNLDLGELDPSLEKGTKVELKDGTEVEVVPVFTLVRERLVDYTPEAAAEVCGAGANAIRHLARKAARSRTNILLGFNSPKYFHGDLWERAMVLMLGLTGNWGKKGTGIRIWCVGPWDGIGLFGAKQQPGPEATIEVLQMLDQMLNMMQQEDPERSREQAAVELQYRTAGMDNTTPPAFFWYFHCGHKENWNRRDWSDPSMKREFHEYMDEALQKGWWQGVARPLDDKPPRIYIECGGDTLRRTRGGQTMLLEHLWPKLKKIVTIDWRMNTTAMYSDIVLPCATHTEKINFHYATVHTMQLILNDRGAVPQGESLPEWHIFRRLCKKVEERAIARGFTEYVDSRGVTRRLDNLYSQYTMDGAFEDDEDVVEEWVRDTALAGALPQGTTLETMREKGVMRFSTIGRSPAMLNQATDIKEDETFCPLRWHVEQKLPYPTLTRRAQFYIDHEWFLEADEQLPCHKENPKMGGDYPLSMTSGHNRWSIHAANIINKIMQETNQGRPFMFMNIDDASERGIREGDEVRAYNDMGDFFIYVKLSPAVRPGQVIVYNGFEPFQFKGWKDPSCVEPGMVKWLHLAGGYGHLRFRPLCWQPVPIDRAVRLEVERVAD